MAAPAATFDGARSGPEFCLAQRSELKIGRKDANDRVRHAVQRDGLSHYILPRAKSLLPRRVAQHHALRRGGLVFSRMEVASQKRRHAQSAEESVAYFHRWNRFRRFAGRQQITAGLVNIEGRKDLIELFPVGIIRKGKIGAWNQCDALGHPHQPRRVGIGQGLDQRRINEAEDRDAGANAQRENDDRGKGKPRVLEQLTQRVAKILN